MKITRQKRFFSMLLSFIMIFNLVVPFQSAFAAGAYGSNYPPHSTSYPNTVIVRDTDGLYYAYQTASLIYYANDAKYLMVDGSQMVRRYVWKNNSWQTDGSNYTYTTANDVGRNVEIAGIEVDFYNITNDFVNGKMKTFTEIVDCNVNITNYNLVPDSTDSKNQFSTPQDIANFGVAMMPNIYDLVGFQDGDTFESVRADFNLATQFTVGELDYNIVWGPSKNKNLVDILDEESVNGVRDGVQKAVLHRSSITTPTTVEIPFKVSYVGNPDTYSNVNASLKITIEPKGSSGLSDSDEKKLWAADVNLDDFVNFQRIVSASGAENYFNNIISDFHIAKKVGNVSIDSVEAVSIGGSDASFKVYKAKDEFLSQKTGYYTSAGVFSEGNKPSNGEYFKTYYSVDSNGTVIKHEDIYETLLNTTNNIVLEKNTIGNNDFYTLADGRVIQCNNATQEETYGYYFENNGTVGFVEGTPSANPINSQGQIIDILLSEIKETTDIRNNKIDQLGNVKSAAINADDTWIIVPQNNSNNLAYAELKIVFNRAGETYVYSAPFVVEDPTSFVQGKPFDQTKYNEIPGTVASTASANSYFASSQTNVLPFNISIKESTGENSWNDYNLGEFYFKDIAKENIIDGITNKSFDIPGTAFSGLDISRGKHVNAPKDGYVFKVNISFNTALTNNNPFNAKDITIKNHSASEIAFNTTGTAPFMPEINITKAQLSTSNGYDFYMFIPSTYISNTIKENILDISWTNYVSVKFQEKSDNPEKVYTNSAVEYTNQKISKLENIISATEMSKYNKTGYTLIGWTSSYYSKDYSKNFYLNMNDKPITDSTGASINDYIAPYIGDTLTAIYNHNEYGITLDLNYLTSSSSAPVVSPAITDKIPQTYDENIKGLPTINGSGTSASPKLERPGYVFKGWFTAPTGGNEIKNGDKFTFSNDVILYAQWTPIPYTFKFSVDDGVKEARTFELTTNFDAVIQLPNIKSEDIEKHRALETWKINKDGNTALLPSDRSTVLNKSFIDYSYLDGNKYCIDVEGIFLWVQHSITFNAAPGAFSEGINERTVNITNTLIFPDTDPTRTGYDFDGWWTQAGKNVTAGDSVVDVPEEIFYAHWEAQEYTVTFNSNGGSTPNPSSKTVAYDSKYGILPDVTRAGHDFKGWWTSAEGGEEITADTIFQKTENITLYAHWYDIPGPYTVKFDLDGGKNDDGSTTIPDQEIYRDSTPPNHDYKITKPVKDPTKEGYTFKGWFYNDAEWDFENGKVSSDMTLKAKWEVNTYELTIDIAGEQTIINVNYGQSVIDKINAETELVKKAKETHDAGMEFDKWVYSMPGESIDGTAVDGTNMGASDVTVKPTYKWSIKVFHLGGINVKDANNTDPFTYDDISNNLSITPNSEGLFSIPQNDLLDIPSGKEVKWYTEATFENEVTGSLDSYKGTLEFWANLIETTPTPDPNPDSTPDTPDIASISEMNTLNLFSARTMNSLIRGLLNDSAPVSYGLTENSDIKYNHSYISLIYQQDYSKTKIYKINANLGTGVADNPELLTGDFEIPYNIPVSSLATNNIWNDSKNSFIGVKTYSNGLSDGEIKGFIEKVGDNISLNYVGYYDESTQLLTKNTPDKVIADSITTLKNMAELTVSGGFPNANRILVFYVSNSDKLTGNEKIHVNTQIQNGYKYSVFSASDLTSQEINIPYSIDDNITLQTAFTMPEIKTMRISTSKQLVNIAGLLGTTDVGTTKISLDADSTFNIDSIRGSDGLSNATISNPLYTAQALNNYSDSAYYMIDINNPNNAEATATLSILQDFDKAKDLAEFVGYIEVSNADSDGNGVNDLIFHKTPVSNVFNYTKDNFNGDVAQVIPIIRVATLRSFGEDVPFNGNGLTIKATNYSMNIGGQDIAIDIERISPRNLTFTISKNTIVSFVDTIAGLVSEGANFKSNSPTSSNDVITELGDYFFIKLDENDTFKDMSNPASLLGTYLNATITWKVEKVSDGGADIRLINDSFGNVTTQITRAGDKDTLIKFIGTVSYSAKTMSSSKVIEIPACIPAVSRNIQQSQINDSYQYVGGYIKVGNDIKVSTDENLSNRFGASTLTDIKNNALDFNIDRTQVANYSIYVSSISVNATSDGLLNGFSVNKGANTFVLETDIDNPTSPTGSTISGNWITVKPNTANFDSAYIVKANNYNKTNALKVNFKPIEVNEVKDGVVYKVRTYTSSELFLGKYPTPNVGSDNYVVMDYGEYVILWTSNKSWTLDGKGLHPMDLFVNEDGTKVDSSATVKGYIAPNWEHLITLENVGEDTVFENLDTMVQGDVSNLLYTSKSIKSNTEKNDKNERIIEVFATPNQLFTRAFYAPNISVDVNNVVKYNGNAVDLYKTSDLTYLAVDHNSNTSHVYNATTNTWTDTTLEALGFTDKVALKGLQLVSSVEASTISRTLMPKAHMSIPTPWNVTGGSDSFALDVYVDLYGSYHLVSTNVGTSQEYILNKYSWISHDGVLVNNGVAQSIPASYQKIAHYDKSDLSSIRDTTFISWLSINVGSIPNLPKPPVQKDPAVLVYDGSYKVYTSNAPIYIDTDNQGIFAETAAVLTCYKFGSNGWEAYPNGNITAQKTGEYYYTGLYQGDVMWTNTSLNTLSGIIVMPAQGLNAFGYYTDGFIHLDDLRSGSSEKKYYIWDRTATTKSIMMRVNSESNDLAPINKPNLGVIVPAPNASWDNNSHNWSNSDFMMDLIVPSYFGSLKIGTIDILKKLDEKSWEINVDGASKTITVPARDASKITINAISESQYKTNIPENKWYDNEQKNADTTKPILDYGYMYQNYIYWEGHDDASNSDNQLVSGIGEHGYGIKFDTMFPYGMPFSAWQQTSSGDWSQVEFTGGLDSDGDVSLIAQDTMLWFDKPIKLNVFNYNFFGDIKVTLMIRDEAGNISEAKQVTIPQNESKGDFKIGELPEDIKKLLEGAEDGNTNDIDAPNIEYIYMYRGQLYIYAEDISVDGRDVSGLAPYAYLINSSVDRVSDINGNASRDGTGEIYRSIVANADIYVNSPVIPIGEIPTEFAMSIKVADAANLNGNSGPSDGGANLSKQIDLMLNKFSNNNVLYGTAPEEIVKMLEKEKAENGNIGTDTIPPVINAIYVGVTKDKVVLGVIATDNSGSPCEYSFDLRTSGTIDYQDKYEIEIKTEDTGVARVYVRDKAGNETSATVFINTSKSSVVYGDPGMIPKDILDKYNIQKTDNVPPTITSVYVYNGKIYVLGYDDVALHATPYGWRPTEDMIISSDFVGVNDEGQPITYYAGNLIPNGTLAFNNKNGQELQIPMSFEVILRDTSDNRTSMSFFVTKDNTCLYGNPPKELEGILDKKEDTSADGLIIEEDGRLQVQMHGDFSKIKWNEYDYKVQMYDGDGRLVYSVEVDEGGTVYIPYYVAGEDIQVIETAIREKDQEELLSKTLTYTTADKTPPVITKVYIMGDKIYVDATDNIALATEPYSFTFENVAVAMEDRFTSSNSKRVLSGDRVIVKVKDEAGNSSSVTVKVGEVKNKTLMTLVNPTQSQVFHVGDNKTVASWGDYFTKLYGLSSGYVLYSPEKGGSNDMFTFGELDATIVGEGSGFIQLYKDDNSPVIYVSAKVNDDGKSGRTAVVQTNSYSNFLLMFKDKFVEEFGTFNGIEWRLETKKNGATKQENYLYVSAPGQYKVVATKNGVSVDYWFLVEKDISTILDTVEMKTTSQRYLYQVGTTIKITDLFDFSKIKDSESVIERIVAENVSDGVVRKGNLINLNETGRKQITLLNLVDGSIFTMQFQVVELYKSIGDYQDIANSWARSEISLLAQYGILEKSADKMFKPNNPVSIKEFISYLDRIDLALNCDTNYSVTELELGISTKDWDYYMMNDFAGLISDATLSEVVNGQSFNRPITRGEAAKLISGSILANEPQRSNVSYVLEDVNDSSVEAAAKHLASLGITTITNNKFRPNDELTRQEMAKMLGKLVEYMR